MGPQHLPRTATADQIVEALKRDGAVIVDAVLASEAMEAPALELRPFLESTPAGPDPFSGFHTRRIGGLPARSPLSRDLVMHPLALAVVAKLLEHATSFRLHLTQAIAIGPGESAQPIHRDQWAFDFFPFPKKGYDVQCNTLWP
jgi:hypothetical protein